jgi:retinoblastoma-like protein 1
LQAFDFTPLDVGEVHQRVYETVEHALYSHTSLMYNRHLDQVILCALYGYCKVG